MGTEEVRAQDDSSRAESPGQATELRTGLQTDTHPVTRTHIGIMVHRPYPPGPREQQTGGQHPASRVDSSQAMASSLLLLFVQ